MAQGIDDLRAEIAKLQATETDTKNRVGAMQASLQQVIDDLRAHPQAEDLTAEIAALEAVNSDLQTVAPAPGV